MTGLRYDSFSDPPKVLVTRAAEDAPVLAQALALGGFEPIIVPLLERRWLPLAIAAAAERHPQADWVLITSATAAEVVSVGAPSAWRGAQWAAVGPATAQRMAELGYRPVRVPDRATAAELVALLGDLTGQKVIYPKADLAAPATVDALLAAGAEVVDVVGYENAAPAGHAERLRAALPVQATTLLSGSAAERVADAIPATDRGLLGQVVAIGPSTAKVARECGLEVHAVAEPHTVAGVVQVVRRLLRGQPE